MRTAESIEIGQVVDRFPEAVRGKLRDALLRIADVYAASGVPMVPLREAREQCDPELRISNVIRLADRRRLG